MRDISKVEYLRQEIFLPSLAREGLRRWLAGRDPIVEIGRVRFAQFQSEQADTMYMSELMHLIDHTGYGILRALIHGVDVNLFDQPPAGKREVSAGSKR